MSNSTAHSRRCTCVQCTADRIHDQSPVTAAIHAANLALKRVYEVLSVASEVASSTYEATSAVNDRTRAGGGIPAVNSVITEELARQEANRADAAIQLLPTVGAILEGLTDLDTTRITVSYVPLHAVDDGADEGGRRG